MATIPPDIECHPRSMTAPLAQLLAEWAIRSPASCVLDPACGDEAFVTAASNQLLSLGAAAASDQVSGSDIDGVAVLAALKAAPRVGVMESDFFTPTPRRDFETAIGNAPQASQGDADA